MRNNAGGTTFSGLTVNAGTDVLEVFHAAGGAMTTLSAAFTVGSTTLNVTSASLFTAGDQLIISDLESGVLLRVTAADTATNTITVTQVKSGLHAKPKTRGTLRALGLGRIGKRNTLPDRPEIRGMIARVPHLVRVEDGADNESS